ncbi:hypothetical protein [Defluviitalea raffinosedens]|uniref:hypothetical protein n=1 Tax=Defluviitalea raffinosedens TaxID=1450156 RepID=UPI00131C79F6|nr:hypothetical protein [Defluviitalea raffinosedens]
MSFHKTGVVRQYLGAFHEIVLYRPELCDTIKAAVEELSRYKNSMVPLLQKDMHKLFK